MVDQMVLKAQKWVNSTYGGVSGYNRCTEDGYTGWETMYSLTRALQYELGITSLSDNFGPTTLGKLTAYGPVGAGSGNIRMRIIAEAALYCKGYSGGAIDGAFDTSTQNGLTVAVRNMGLNPKNVVTSVAPKVFKALLNMDAYVLVNDGDADIQTCQRWLNGAYINRGEFFVGPCDGHFSRNVQAALVLAIQYKLGMTDDQVTGEIGPKTQAGLRSEALLTTGSAAADWIRLFQCAVAFNGYRNDWGDSGGTFTAGLERTVLAFQEFCHLPQTGDGDYQTWMSLLVSTGDPDRQGTACDCMVPFNSTTIQLVKSAGYRIVGRYLTGGTNKRLTNSEIALINDNGLSFFPIYQEEGNALRFFSYDQGYAAGEAACEAAISFGIPEGTVIYFSVDYDAVDTEITSAVIPHFEGIRDAVASSPKNYAIGVYGCRNVCGRLSKAGLTIRSFVSGLSTGFSGNLGFPLPDNWAFDQIKNFILTNSYGSKEIDNDIVSGRDPGLNSVTRPRDPNDAFFTYLIWLEARAGQYKEDPGSSYTAAQLVAQYLRKLDPVNDLVIKGVHVSDQVFGEYDSGFIEFVNSYIGMPDRMPLRDPVHLWDMDISHFGASFGAVATHGLPSSRTDINFVDFGSWGGDLLSILGQFVQSGEPDSNAYQWARAKIASTASDTFFGRSDFLADVDAIVIGTDARNYPSERLLTMFLAYYGDKTAAQSRFGKFLTLRFGNSYATVQTAAEVMLGSVLDAKLEVIRDVFWVENFGSTRYPLPQAAPEGVRKDVAKAFAAVVNSFVTG